MVSGRVIRLLLAIFVVVVLATCSGSYISRKWFHSGSQSGNNSAVGVSGGNQGVNAYSGGGSYSTPTPTPTSVPIPTPTPAAGMGQGVQRDGVSITVTDVQFRGSTDTNSEDKAAIPVTLTIQNGSNSTAEVDIVYSDVAAIDNEETGYSDAFTAAHEWWNAHGGMCMFASVDWSQYQTMQLSIPPSSSKDAVISLAKNGTEGSCGTGGIGTSRVDIGVNFITFSIRKIQVRTDHLITFDHLTWRLLR